MVGEGAARQMFTVHSSFAVNMELQVHTMFHKSYKVNTGQMGRARITLCVPA